MPQDDLIASVQRDITRVYERRMALMEEYNKRLNTRAMLHLERRISGLYAIQQDLEYTLQQLVHSREGRIRF